MRTGFKKDPDTFNLPVIVVNREGSAQRAKNIATTLGVPLRQSLPSEETLIVEVTPSRIQLCLRPSKMRPVYVDFLDAAFRWRTTQASRSTELLARAVGIKPGIAQRVLDVTGGLGKDAVVLAGLGCDVTLIERHPVIALLLEDGVERAKVSAWFNNLLLQLIKQDALDFLQKPCDFEVIYLDPMYPEQKKKAAGKREMQILRKLVGSDRDAENLLALALKRARQRVVIKRPRLIAPVPSPNFSLWGQSTRFDVYLVGERIKTK